MSEHEIKMRDLVFPIVAAKKLSDGYSYERFLGTGFWVGSQGYALTAGHVVEQSIPDSCCFTGMFVHPRDNYWLVFELNSKSVHSTEDVALISLQGRLEEGSSIQVSFESQHSAFEYHPAGSPKFGATSQIALSSVYE